MKNSVLMPASKKRKIRENLSIILRDLYTIKYELCSSSNLLDDNFEPQEAFENSIDCVYEIAQDLNMRMPKRQG